MIPKLKCSYSTISPEELMAHVVPEYCIDNPLECLFWERGANDTYQVRCTNARYFLRVYRCGAYPREANEFEAEALHYLHQQGYPVAYPIARKSGGFISEIAAPEGTRYILLTTLAGGTSADYKSKDICRQVGESIARMHLAANGFSSSYQRTPLDLQGLLENPMVVIRRYMSYRQDAVSMINKIAQDASDAVNAVPEELLDNGLCHGDLHGGNLHIQEGTVTHFDFEECAFGYRVYDIATLKWSAGLIYDEQRTERWLAALEGYESVRPLSEPERSLIDTFVIIREISEMAYGIRHVRDFGYNDIMATDIDEVCERLDKYVKFVGN